MNIHQLAKILNIPSKFVDNSKLNELMQKKAYEYKQDKEAVISEIEKEENYCEKLLYLILHLAIMAKEEYKKQEISEQIWLDTMRDIRIWQKAYENKYQKSGILEHRWVLQIVNMEIFKLGSLQFEKIKLGEDVKLAKETLKKGDFVLNTHIQEGTDLSPKKLKESYSNAVRFFGIKIFVCDSWLLSQDLKKLLPSNSNIINFQNSYEIVSEIKPHKQMEERVFGDYQKDKATYPETTSLQKNLKKYLIAGNAVAMTKGYFRL